MLLLFVNAIINFNPDCDQMHDGLGFLTNHGAETMQFEQSLQAVDPSVSVPYWDYTIDMTNYELSGAIESFYGSVVFSPDFFGSSWSSYSRATIDDDDSSNDDDDGNDDYSTMLNDDYDDDDDGLGGSSNNVDPEGRILSGRFQRVQLRPSYWGLAGTGDDGSDDDAGDDAEEDEDENLSTSTSPGYIVNAYGLIRAPWNVNNDPFVNRFNKVGGLRRSPTHSSQEACCHPFSFHFISFLFISFLSFILSFLLSDLRLRRGGLRWRPEARSKAPPPLERCPSDGGSSAEKTTRRGGYKGG